LIHQAHGAATYIRDELSAVIQRESSKRPESEKKLNRTPDVYGNCKWRMEHLLADIEVTYGDLGNL
jgi:hypothetical protein